MRKHIYTSILVLLVSINTVQSQEIADHSIGLRLSESDGVWVEIAYQAGLSTKTRIELDFGMQGKRNFNAIKLTGIYQWVFPIDEGLQWFVGPGLGGGLIDYEYVQNRSDSDLFGFITGDIGIEYNFDFPLLLSLDFRPEIYFDQYNNDSINFNVGLSAKYQF